MLDECATIAPLGDAPKLVAELGDLGITTGKSSSWTPRRMPVLPIGDIANLAPNHAAVVFPHLRPRIAYLPSWRDDRSLAALVGSDRRAEPIEGGRV